MNNSPTIRNTEPDTLEDLRAVSEGQEVYMEYREVDNWGIPAIDGEVVEKHENSSEDHAATIALLDNSRGHFDLILNVDEDGLHLDGGIEAQSDGRGYHVIEMEAVETLEIGEGNERVERTECWNCGYNRPTWEACPECGEYGGDEP